MIEDLRKYMDQNELAKKHKTYKAIRKLIRDMDSGFCHTLAFRDSDYLTHLNTKIKGIELLKKFNLEYIDDLNTYNFINEVRVDNQRSIRAIEENNETLYYIDILSCRNIHDYFSGKIENYSKEELRQAEKSFLEELKSFKPKYINADGESELILGFDKSNARNIHFKYMDICRKHFGKAWGDN